MSFNRCKGAKHVSPDTAAEGLGARVQSRRAPRTPDSRPATAVRNMEQAGVPRSVAMKLNGHKTENVYRRYAVVSDVDLEEAARRIAGRAASVTLSSRSAVAAGKPLG